MDGGSVWFGRVLLCFGVCLVLARHSFSSPATVGRQAAAVPPEPKCGEDGGFPYIFSPEVGLKREQFHNAEIVELHHVVISADGRILDARGNGYVQGAHPCFPAEGCTAATFGDHSGLMGHDHVASYEAAPDSRRFRHVISLAGFWQYGVWHFLHEAFAVVRLDAQNSTELLPIRNSTVIHVAQRNAWVLAWLDLAGISAEQGYTIVDGTIAAKVAVLPKLGGCGGMDQGHLSWLRQQSETRVGALYGHPAPRCNDILLLRRTNSRQFGGAAFKELYALMETIAALHRLTVTVFDDGYFDTNLVHQMHHWRRACLVVAPHGAGLTMLVAMAPGTCAIEIFPDDYDTQKMYGSLARSLGISYDGSLRYKQRGGLLFEIAQLRAKMLECTALAGHDAPVR